MGDTGGGLSAPRPTRGYFEDKDGITPAAAPLGRAPARAYTNDMIAELLKRLTAPTTPPLDQPDSRLALAALLVRIARSDGEYAHEEADRIAAVLAEYYGLDHDAAIGLRKQAEEVEAGAPDTVRFTRAIKDGVPYEERVYVIEAAWSIVLADGIRDNEEDALLRLVANLLGVNDRDSALARQKVQASG